MSKDKRIEIIICLFALIFLLISIVGNPVSAINLNDLRNNESNVSSIPESSSPSSSSSSSSSSAKSSSVNNIPVSSAANNNTALPYTGPEDTMLYVVIIICVISAIYAYKKIKDYNNI